LGGTQSAGFGINDRGWVVGVANLGGDLGAHAFLYQDGTMHDLGTLGGPSSYAFGINNSGVVTGGAEYASGSGARHAFLYDGTMHDIGTLGGSNSEGLAINDSGWIVGDSYTAGGITFSDAFLYEGGTMYDLNSLLAPTDPLYGMVAFLTAYAINDAGQIVAIGLPNPCVNPHNCSNDRPVFTYLLTPVASTVPEPTSLALLGVGVFGVLYACRQGRRPCTALPSTCGGLL